MIEEQNIESRLAELQDAEKAGLFERTELSPATFQAALSDRQGPMAIPAGLRVAIAAAIVLAVGLGAWMFSVEIEGMRRFAGKSEGHGALARAVCRDHGILNCLGGPTQLARADSCSDHDYDADGDVDLADFSAFQRRCQTATR